MSMTTMDRPLSDLCKNSHEMSRSKGWYNGEEKDPRSIQLVTLLMQSELSEALEEWRGNEPIDRIYYTCRGTKLLKEQIEPAELKEHTELYKPEGILVELADCVIRIAQRFGSDEVDLETLMNQWHDVLDVSLFTSDFEEMLATAMASLSCAYLCTPLGGHAMLRTSLNVLGMEATPHLFMAHAVCDISCFCDRKELDLWGAIYLKADFNATRPHRHGDKKA